jgi:hypothetical protein
MTSRGEILNEAADIIGRDRNVAYGEPERNFDRIAQMWGAYKGVVFEPHDVAAMLALLKIARIAVSPDRLDRTGSGHWMVRPPRGDGCVVLAFSPRHTGFQKSMIRLRKLGYKG